MKGWMPHERALAVDVFEPRTCTFHLEQDVFKKPYPDDHSFAFGMAFDKSPYPPI